MQDFSCFGRSLSLNDEQKITNSWDIQLFSIWGMAVLVTTLIWKLNDHTVSKATSLKLYLIISEKNSLRANYNKNVILLNTPEPN